MHPKVKMIDDAAKARAFEMRKNKAGDVSPEIPAFRPGDRVKIAVRVERIFPINSPIIQSLEVVKRGHVRRAKLYYLRGMSDKKIRQKLS